MVSRVVSLALMLTHAAMALAQTTVPGSIEAKFDVDAAGSATYSIPLVVPPGTNDREPKLTFVYSNNAPNGIAGVGWTLAGLPTVVRVQPNLEQDGIRTAISFGPTDRYAYDGERLIAISGPDGGNGTQYRTEIESWNLAFSNFNQGNACGNGPCSFTVRKKDGTVFTFGGTTDSRILAAGTQSVRVWALSSAVDLHGNTMTVAYTQTPFSGASNDGQVYPSSVSYTSNSGQSLGANRTIAFTYSSRTDVETMWVAGSKVSTTALLTGMTVSLQNNVVQAYKLNYAPAHDTGRNLLNSIQQCSGTSASAQCLSATTFGYQSMGTTFKDQGTWSSDWVPPIWSPSLPLFLVDANADGLTDVVGIDSQNNLQAALSTGSLFGPMTKWANNFGLNWTSATPRLFADVTGDGRADFVGFNFQSVIVAPATTSSTFDRSRWTSVPFNNFGFNQGYTSQNPRLLADVNGDGLADIVGFGTSTFVSLSTGNSFKSPVNWNPSSFTGGNFFLGQGAIRLVGDVNGDGLGDVVGFSQPGIIVGLSTGSSFSTANWSQNATGFPYFGLNQGWQVGVNNRVLADMNGDGLMDIVGFQKGVQVALSTGNGFLPPTPWSPAFSPESRPPFRGSNPIYVVDANGDGKADVTGFGNGGASVAISTGSSLSGTWTQSLDSYRPRRRIAMADFNGDGLTDVVSFGASSPTATTVALAAPPYPDLLTSITEGLGGTFSITYAPLTSGSVYSTTTSPSVTTPVATAYFNVPAATAINSITANYPVRTLASGRINLVATETKQNAPSISTYAYSDSKSHRYTNALFDLQAVRFLGFATRTKTGKNRLETTSYNQTYPLQLMPSMKQTFCSPSSSDPRCTPNALLLSTSFTYATPQTATGSGPLAPPVYDVQRTSKQEDTYLYGTWDYSIRSTFAYDSFGNRSQKNYLGYVTLADNDISTNDNVYTGLQYLNNPSPTVWTLGFLQYRKQSSTAASSTNFGTFTNGVDLSLQRRTYSTDGLLNLHTESKWDSQNNAYLTTTYGYDGFGNRTSETGPNGGTETTTYDATYRTYRDVTTSPQNMAGTSLKTSYGYDGLYGRRIATADPNGNVSIRALDPFGREAAQQTTAPSPSQIDPSALPSYVTGSFNFVSAPVNTVESQSWSSGNGAVYVTEQQLQTFPTSGARDFLWMRSFYDGRNRLVQTTTQSASPPGNVVVCRTVDSEGDPTRQSVPTFVSGTSLVCGTDAAPAIVATRVRDAYKRPLTDTAPSGPSGTKTVTRTYAYGPGNVTTITDAAATPSSYPRAITYQLANDKAMPVKLVVPGPATSTFVQDRLGRLTSATDPPTPSNPSGVTNTWTYDSLDRTIALSNPDQGSISYRYDPRGNLATVTMPLTTLTSTYDLLGRVVSQTAADQSSIRSTYDQSISSNGLGRLTSTTYTNGSNNLIASDVFGYDAMGNGTSRAITYGGQNGSYTTVRSYDPQNRVVGITFPDGSKAARTYATGLLSSLAANGTSYVNFSNPSAGGDAQTMALGNGLVATFDYSPMSQLNGYSLKNGSTTVAGFTYAWSPLSQLMTATDANNATLTFTYLNRRLTNASSSSGNSSYGYDASGNMTLANGVTYAYTAHRPTGGTNAQQQTVLKLAYDAAGNVLSRNAGGTTTSFTYDANNRLLTAGNASYAYDYDGSRISAVAADGTVTLYPDDDYEITIAPEGGDRTITRYLTDDSGNRVLGLRGAAAPSLSPLFIHTSTNSSTFLTTTASGAVGTAVKYDPFGLPTLSGPDDFAPKFTGRDYDPAPSLSFFNARYYDPTTQHFLSPDTQLGRPLTEQDALNRYSYLGGDPVNQVDPTGNVWETVVEAGQQLATKAGQLLQAAGRLQNVANTVRALSQQFGQIAEAADIDALSDESLVAASRLAQQLDFVAGAAEADALNLGVQSTAAQAILDETIPFLADVAADTSITASAAIGEANLALQASAEIGQATTAATAAADEALTAGAEIIEASITAELSADEALVGLLALFGL